jgi:hypothetical protein
MLLLLLLLLLPLLLLQPELDGAASGEDGLLHCWPEQQERRLSFTSRPFFLLCCLQCCSGWMAELADGYAAPVNAFGEAQLKVRPYNHGT